MKIWMICCEDFVDQIHFYTFIDEHRQQQIDPSQLGVLPVSRFQYHLQLNLLYLPARSTSSTTKHVRIFSRESDVFFSCLII